jgi:hypothetical protein
VSRSPPWGESGSGGFIRVLCIDCLVFPGSYLSNELFFDPEGHLPENEIGDSQLLVGCFDG